MFDVLVYMFENFIDSQFRPDENTLSQQLAAAGFDEKDISHAFLWFNQLERKTSQSNNFSAPKHTSSRIITAEEYKKFSLESLDFIIFLVQANIINTTQRELILELALKLPQHTVSHDEFRWVVLMTTWGSSQAHAHHAKDYMLLEDVLMSKQKPTLH
ncbi:MAG: DUF494 domain-containing protein [Methylophilaceae bacterium]